MSLLGSMGGISFDQERDRLDRIRQQLTAQFRRATTAIESDLEQSSQWLRELLGTTMPALRQTFEAQARLTPEVTAAVEDALRDARALSPEQLAAAARSELAAQLDQARNEQIRRLSELGVDPTSLRTTALDRMTQVQGAGEIARTGILARLAGIDQRGAALARAFDLYRAGSATGLAGLG
ncbi:MAG: hypothetical protein NZ518_02120, partial [Dehalococcoidia bacterium]|nr:hypothetical protein [Dehalococcoidia bacterium]